MRLLLLVLSVLALTACPLDPGDPCDAEGSGFTRTDPCGTQCIEWDVLCADGSTAVPNVCAGSSCTNNPAACANGWGCVQVNATDSVCLPQDVCPGGFGTGQPLACVRSDAELDLEPLEQPGAGVDVPPAIE